MKPRNVHRDVSTTPLAELHSHTPVLGIGKVSRIHRTYSRDRKRRPRNAKGALLREYLTYVFSLVAVVLVAGTTWVLFQQKSKKTDTQTVTTLTEETFVIPHPSASECVALVKSFVETGSPSQLPLTSRIKSLDADQAYMAFTELRKNMGEVERYDWAGAEETNGLSLEMVMVIYKSGKYRIAYLTHDEHGNWKVDLESYLGHNTRPWEQIMGKSSCKAIVRILATPDVYYNGLFSNEAEWRCFALTSPDHPGHIYGYLKPKTPAMYAVEEMLLSKNPVVMMAEISRDAAMEPRQYEIKKVISQGWVESDVEFSSRFLRGSIESATAQ